MESADDQDLSSLKKYGDPSMVAAAMFNSDAEKGLQATFINVQGLKQADPPSFHSFLLKQINSCSLLLLIITAVICFIGEMAVQNPSYGWPQGVDILFNFLILVFVPSINKYFSARKDMKKMKLKRSAVIRDGRCQDVGVSEVVEGDLVLLRKGDAVPGDGLLVSGSGLVTDNILDSDIDCNDNPFLLSSSTILKGEGRLLVVSVGANTSLGDTMLLMNRNPDEEALFQAQMKELNKIVDYIVMFIYIIITLVVLVDLFCTGIRHKNHQGSSTIQSPNLMSKGFSELVEPLFKKMFLRSRGKIILLIFSITAVVLGLQGILPPTTSASLFWWNRKLNKNHQIHSKNLYSVGTMGLATTLIIDVSKGLLVAQCREAAKVATRLGVSIILVSRDEEEMLKAISNELDIVAPSEDFVVNGDMFEQADVIENNLTIKMMYKCDPRHILLLIKALREKGHVVAHFGGLTTLDTPALKEADVGIVEERYSCALAQESADIILHGKESMLPLLISGKFVYCNIAPFIETLHVTSFSILFMASILKPLHLIWANVVVHIIGFAIILMEVPKKRNISLRVKVLSANVARKVFCQALVLLSIWFTAKWVMGHNEGVAKVVIFNIFTMFQVFYLFQTMELGDMEVLKVSVKSHGFLVAIGLAMVCHVIVINSAKSLNLVNWAFCFLHVFILWGFDWTVQSITKCFASAVL